MNKHTRVWSLQEAKAKFSEVVRRAQTEGPQEITLHGKHVVTISPAGSEPAIEDNRTGKDLIAAMQACPYPDFEIPERDEDAFFRPVKL
jgi:prevent-host-death family protein